ncbi:hypothetical protein [Paenibacillus sp. 1P03SA]|uniref:hypothetical protein n=1 Tax=Paenibacillus sp. 1P03SA TaxID=3132294 RepID=UPI00399FEB6A
MVIKLEDFKDVIDIIVNNTLSKLNGDLAPKIDTRTARAKLGMVSSLIIELRDKVEDPELKSKIWDLKKECDTHLEQLYR